MMASDHPLSMPEEQVPCLQNANIPMGCLCDTSLPSHCSDLGCHCFMVRVHCNQYCSCKGEGDCPNKPTVSTVAEAPTPLRSCTCKKSHCIKGNCQCFTHKQPCNETCLCENCLNKQGSASASRTGLGCSCKKSHCLKMHCGCFKRTTGCTSCCFCVECENAHGKNE